MFQTYARPCSTRPSDDYMSAGETKDAGPVPVLIDTDIGDDIDDAFCLTLAFMLHRDRKINLLCVTTSGKGSHEERAGLVKRLQVAILGEQMIPIFKGSTDGESKRNYMSEALAGPFQKFESKVLSVAEMIRNQTQKVLVICIGPLDNVRHLVDAITDPSKVRLCLMGGSFFKSFDAQPPQIAEYNVRKNIENWRHVVSHMDALIIPLDVAGDARLKDWPRRLQKLLPEFRDMYQKWYSSVLVRDGLGSRILAGTMPIGERPVLPGQLSSVMFDAVALCIALNPDTAVLSRSAVEVTDDGFTNMVEGSHKVDVALSWHPSFNFTTWCDQIANVSI